MVINNDFELVYLVIAFAFLGVILFGSLLVTLRLDRWHPKLIGALDWGAAGRRTDRSSSDVHVTGATEGAAALTTIPACEGSDSDAV